MPYNIKLSHFLLSALIPSGLFGQTDRMTMNCQFENEKIGISWGQKQLVWYFGDVYTGDYSGRANMLELNSSHEFVGIVHSPDHFNGMYVVYLPFLDEATEHGESKINTESRLVITEFTKSGTPKTTIETGSCISNVEKDEVQ